MNALRSPGRWLQIVGFAHLLYGLTDFRSEWASILGHGVWASIPNRGDDATAFWFLLGAPLMWTTGLLLRRAESGRDAPSQRTVGWVVTGTGVLGVVLDPVSPFWVVAAIGLAALHRARTEPAPTPVG